MLTLADNRAIPVQAVAFEIPQDTDFSPGFIAQGIQVVDPHLPGPASSVCVQVAGGGSQQGPQMQGAGG